MFKRLKKPGIEFLCYKDDWSVIPEPYPARKLIPDWYKKIEQRIGGVNKLENSTIKRCAPVLDAFCIGWIIPLAADVEIITNDDASGLTWKSNFYREMIGAHSADQINSKDHQHPESPKPPMKFLNYWQVNVDPGYSMMFMPPMNRADPRFECLSGIVDEGYNEFINFPFFFKQPNYTGILKRGTPLVQLVVIKKEEFKVEIASMSDADLEKQKLTRRKRQAHESHYRDDVWRKL